jgi:hypothetical protein
MKRNKLVLLMVMVVTVLAAAMAALPAAAEEPGDMRIPISDDAVLYRKDDGDVEIWAYNSEDYWDIVIRLSADELDAVDDSPEAGELVTSFGSIAVYRSSNGEWTVSNGPDAEGKTRVAVFDEDFLYSHEYEFNVYD